MRNSGCDVPSTYFTMAVTFSSSCASPSWRVRSAGTACSPSTRRSASGSARGVPPSLEMVRRRRMPTATCAGARGSKGRAPTLGSRHIVEEREPSPVVLVAASSWPAAPLRLPVGHDALDPLGEAASQGCPLGLVYLLRWVCLCDGSDRQLRD